MATQQYTLVNPVTEPVIAPFDGAPACPRWPAPASV